jgi:hypothetical protein
MRADKTNGIASLGKPTWRRDSAFSLVCQWSGVMLILIGSEAR